MRFLKAERYTQIPYIKTCIEGYFTRGEAHEFLAKRLKRSTPERILKLNGVQFPIQLKAPTEQPFRSRKSILQDLSQEI